MYKCVPRTIRTWVKKSGQSLPEKYTNKILVLLGMEECKPVSTPGLPENDIVDGDEEDANGKDVSVFRSGTGLALYLRNYLFDIQNAVCHLTQELKKPSRRGMRRLR